MLNMDSNEKKERLFRLKIALLSLLFVTGAKFSYDSYRIDEGKEYILDEFNDYYNFHLSNPYYNEAYVIINNETYTIKDGIEEIISGCKLNGMSDDEITVALLEYFPSGYVDDYMNTSPLKLRKTCIDRYKKKK